MMNTTAFTPSPSTALQRLENLARFCKQSHSLGTRTRPELIKSARAYCDRSRLNLSLSLIVEVCALGVNEDAIA